MARGALRSVRGLRGATRYADPGFAAAKRAQSLIALIMLEKILVVLVRKTSPLSGGRVSRRCALVTRVGKQHQFLRFVYRQLLKSYRVKQREDCGVGADAQRQRADRDQRKSGSLDQIPKRVTNVAKERLHIASFYSGNAFTRTSAPPADRLSLPAAPESDKLQVPSSR